jgi:hypothetical protein
MIIMDPLINSVDEHAGFPYRSNLRAPEAILPFILIEKDRMPVW